MESQSEALKPKLLKRQMGRLRPLGTQGGPILHPGRGAGLLALQREGGYGYTHFTKEESEAQKGAEICRGHQESV